MSVKQIVDEIYASYLKAEPYFKADVSDAVRRNPELLLPYLSVFPKERNIVITGSKGKGSLARMLAALLSAREKTGLFVSPHIVEFNERIAVDGQTIPDAALERTVRGVLRDAKPVLKGLRQEEYVSPIGILALAAMRYFSEEHTKWNVLECGKGARYDDVNRIRHEYAVIGTIFLEHAKELGSTVEEIAADKACVMTKDVCCVYVMEQQPTVREVIRQRAKEMGVSAKWFGEDFAAERIRQGTDGVCADIRIGKETFREVRLSLLGTFQAKHAALALAMLSDILPGTLSDRAVWERALSSVRIPGRMEILRTDPFCLLDSCINRQSTKEVVRLLGELGIDCATTILCLPDDKDVAGVAEEMSRVSESMIFSHFDHPHYPMSMDPAAFLANCDTAYAYENDFKKAFLEAESFGRPIVILVANTFVQYAKQLLPF